MLWLVIAIIALAVSVLSQFRAYPRWQKASVAAFDAALILWILSQAGVRVFRGSETSLLGYFVVGLAILAAGELMAGWTWARAVLAQAATPLAALAFALGFDVLRPDAYSYIPAAIVGAMVLIVAWRAYSRLVEGNRKKSKKGNLAGLLLYVLAVAVLLYSAVFKMIDRGWAPQWAYLASGGALMFASSQLWLGWETILKQKRTPSWVREGAMNLGILMMVISALFVYREFL
jgi:hypothetical protein